MRILVALLLVAGCGGGANDGAADAAPVPRCPAAAPADGASCDRSVRCLYDRCDTDGLVTADCDGDRWAVTAAACDQLSCQGNSCAPGAICTAYSGGAYLVDCRLHACGDGPLTCDCVCGDLTPCVQGDSVSGEALFTCNTCNADICP